MSPLPVAAYFAYGSNMNPSRVAERGLEVVEVEAATLDGFELRFNKAGAHHPGTGHANIEPRTGAQVAGVLYYLANHEEILKMDPFERAPINYGRDVVALQAAGRVVWGWTYFANVAVKQDGLNPSQEYLDHLLAGERYLPRDYFEALKSTKTA